MKRIIITGASDGLGYELAKLCVEKGIEVVCLSRTKPKDINVEHIEVDLVDRDQLTKAIAVIKESYSEFGALINNAAKIVLEPMGGLTHEATEGLFDLNVLAPTMLTSGLFDLIKKNEADIVNVASTVGYKAYKDQAAYGVSKWAIRGLIENLRLELADTRCRVIGFAPGGFQSGFVQKFTGDQGVDLSGYMDPKNLAKLLLQILESPKEMEVSEIVINRKKK